MKNKVKAFRFSTWAVSFALGLVFLLSSWSAAAIDTIAVDVGISVFKTMPIGIVPFVEPKENIEWIEEKPHQILTRDANLSGRFEVVASEKFNLALFSRSNDKQ